MMDSRHQAGWLGFLDGNTGEILENTSMDK